MIQKSVAQVFGNKYVKYGLLLVFTFLHTHASAQNSSAADNILGKWISEQKNVIVQVYRNGKNEFEAKLIWFNDSDDPTKPMNTRVDDKNPNEALRSRKLIGMEVLDNLTYNNNTKTWENGEIYDAKSGRTWSSAASIDNDGLLKVSGYWHFKFLGKSMLFKRLTSEDALLTAQKSRF